MKTLTELSGILIRKAAAAIDQVERSLPRPKAPAVAAEPPPESPAEASAAPVPAQPDVPVARQGRPEDQAESEEAKVALDAAVAAATGLSGDRLARLRDAVKAVGGRVEDVRLVRVFGPEEPVAGAQTLNGFQYVVDLAPASMRQDGALPKKERFGRGGDRGRGGGGKGAPKSGGFSMDSLKDDRKGQRGGPRGRGKPGGGTQR
jgi:translation initiation factor IF-2